MAKTTLIVCFIVLASGRLQAKALFDLNQKNAANFVCPTTEAEWLRVKENVALALTSNTQLLPSWVENCLGTLEIELTSSEKLQGCFSDLVRIKKDMRSIPSSLKSFKGKTIDYFKASAEHVDVSPELKADEFLKALGEGQIEVAEAYLEKQNLSRHLLGKGKFDYAFLPSVPLSASDRTGKRRFFVYDPDLKPCLPFTEKWLSFTIGGEKAQAVELSVVATHWSEDDGPSTYFATHSRAWEDGRIIIKSALETAEKQRSLRPPECYECHSNGGPLAIQSTTPPHEKYMPSINRINARIAEIPMGFNQHFEPKRLKMGREAIDIDKLPDHFLTSCFADAGVPRPWQKESLNNLRQTLACHQCHDGATRAKLPAELAEGVFTHRFINGSLPPGNSLSAPERLALSKCVDRYLSLGKRPGMLFYQWYKPQCSQ